MKTMTKAAMAAALGLCTLASAPAGAALFDFSYLTFGGTTVSGQVDATDLGGFYSVDNVTGLRNGLAIDGYNFYDDTPQSFTFQNGQVGDLDFSFYVGADNFEVRYPGGSYGTEFTNGTSSDLVTRFTFAAASPVTGAVPEPALWAMMIAGFGVVGAAVRRRGPVVGSTTCAT